MRTFLFLAVATITVLRTQTHGINVDNITQQVTENDIQTAINLGIDSVQQCKNREETTVSPDTTLLPHTPDYKAYLDFSPRKKALNKVADSFVIEVASKHLYNYIFIPVLSPEAAITSAYITSELSLYGTKIGRKCIAEQSPTCDSTKYRSIDGSCNNAKKPNLGAATTAYYRLFYPRYYDDIFGMNVPQFDPESLPNPRLISTTLSTDSNDLEETATIATMVWGQFVANDLSQTAVNHMLTGKKIYCCNKNGGKLPIGFEPCFCRSIVIPKSDATYGPKKIRCMSYVRSVTTISSNCTFGPLQQMNQVSHYLDASMVYGTDHRISQRLRSLKGGNLRMTKRSERKYLPKASRDSETECEGTCYRSGDARVNDQPQITAIYTIWVREHNRIAAELHKLHSNWSDETIYQEARRIVIAKIQRITYYEWLPEVLSSDKAKEINSKDYDAEVNPEVSNEAATAALRSISSLVQQEIGLVNEERRVTGNLRLYENFFNPRVIESNNTLDHLLRGLATQASSKMDLNFATDLTNKYYANNGEVGLDLFTLDIWRGRDHGLHSYNKYRSWCGLPSVKNFTELSDQIPEEIIEKLKKLYKKVHKIDLIIGLLAEKRVPKSLVGFTLECLLAEQFKRTREGDRFFYENTNQPYPFTTEQLAELKKVSLAKIICDNGDNIQQIQPNVFRKPGAGNEIKPCSEMYTPRIVI